MGFYNDLSSGTVWNSQGSWLPRPEVRGRTVISIKDHAQKGPSAPYNLVPLVESRGSAAGSRRAHQLGLERRHHFLVAAHGLPLGHLQGAFDQGDLPLTIVLQLQLLELGKEPGHVQGAVLDFCLGLVGGIDGGPAGEKVGVSGIGNGDGDGFVIFAVLVFHRDGRAFLVNERALAGEVRPVHVHLGITDAKTFVERADMIARGPGGAIPAVLRATVRPANPSATLVQASLNALPSVPVSSRGVNAEPMISPAAAKPPVCTALDPQST